MPPLCLEGRRRVAEAEPNHALNYHRSHGERGEKEEEERMRRCARLFHVGPNRRRWMLPAKTMMRVLLFTYRRRKSETMYLKEGEVGGRGVKIDENEMR